jgi:hypothetical protein
MDRSRSYGATTGQNVSEVDDCPENEQSFTAPFNSTCLQSRLRRESEDQPLASIEGEGELVFLAETDVESFPDERPEQWALPVVRTSAILLKQPLLPCRAGAAASAHPPNSTRYGCQPIRDLRHKATHHPRQTLAAARDLGGLEP